MFSILPLRLNSLDSAPALSPSTSPPFQPHRPLTPPFPFPIQAEDVTYALCCPPFFPHKPMTPSPPLPPPPFRLKT
jgi:hypothetical protein